MTGGNLVWFDRKLRESGIQRQWEEEAEGLIRQSFPIIPFLPTKTQVDLVLGFLDTF